MMTDRSIPSWEEIKAIDLEDCVLNRTVPNGWFPPTQFPPHSTDNLIILTPRSVTYPAWFDTQRNVFCHKGLMATFITIIIGWRFAEEQEKDEVIDGQMGLFK